MACRIFRHSEFAIALMQCGIANADRIAAR